MNAMTHRLILFVWLIPLSGQAQTRSTYTMPAEWEPQDAVWMGLRTEETKTKFDTTTIEMIRALTPFVTVNLILEKDALFGEGKGSYTSQNHLCFGQFADTYKSKRDGRSIE